MSTVINLRLQNCRGETVSLCLMIFFSTVRSWLNAYLHVLQYMAALQVHFALSIYWSISLRQLILVNIPEIDLHPQNVSLEKIGPRKKPRAYILLISQIRKSRRVEIALDSLLQFIPASVLPRQQDSQRQNYEHFRDIANDHSGDPERVGWTFRGGNCKHETRYPERNLLPLTAFVKEWAD